MYVVLNWSSEAFYIVVTQGRNRPCPREPRFSVVRTYPFAPVGDSVLMCDHEKLIDQNKTTHGIQHRYSVVANIYAAGKPCPMHNLQFCGGYNILVNHYFFYAIKIGVLI